MDVDEAFGIAADFTDAWPLGVEAMRTVHGVAGLGQPVGVPLPAVEDLEDDRAVVPADGPHRVGIGVRVAADPARAGDVEEARAVDLAPACAVPFVERADLLEVLIQAIPEVGGLVPRAPVIGVNHATLAAVQALAVIPMGEVGSIAAQCLHFQAVDIDLVETFLHGRVVDLVLRVGQMPGVTREPAWHHPGRNDANVPFLVDEVRPDEQLPGLLVDHPIGWGPAHALRLHEDVVAVIDLE